MIEWIWNRNQSRYQSVDETQQNQVFFIPFEDFVQRPFVYVQPLAEFLGSATTKRTKGAVKRQNCPRTLQRDVTRTTRSIEELLSDQEADILHRLIAEYEALVGECAR
jgi:hypothetical protein